MPYFTPKQIEYFVDDGKEFLPEDTARKHFSHEHPLIQRELSGKGANLTCRVCLSDIQGRSTVHCCEKCGFFIHDRCANLPPEFWLLQVHPRHPLTLERPGNFCSICLNVGSFMYSCRMCDIRLDVACALAILPSEGTKTIDLPFHDHTLRLFRVKDEGILRECEVCREPISGKVYGCFACQFYLHERCVSARCEIQPLNCPADSVPDADTESVVELRRREDVKCKVCDLNISGKHYVSLDSEFSVHKSCIDIPLEILHYLHPEHSLTLVPNLSKFFLCRACMSGGKPAMTFSCPGCNFDLHVECALRTLESVEAGVLAKIEYPLFEVPLELGYVKDHNDLDHKCLACKKHLKGLSYFISNRGIRVWLHKSCAELKSEIEHPFHPRHPLALHVRNGGDQLRCNACRRRFDGFAFFCRECEFYLDFSCALLKPTFKHHLHGHELAYFEEAEFLECNLCHRHCHVDLHRCVLCNFNIHHDCLTLPRIVKSRCHSYPFRLVHSIVEDDSGEYYCDVCEKERKLDLGAYYCATGSVIVHIKCVLPMLNFEQKMRDDLGLDEVNKEIAHLKATLAEIEKQRDEIERKQEEVTRKLVAAEKRRSTLSL